MYFYYYILFLIGIELGDLLTSSDKTQSRIYSAFLKLRDAFWVSASKPLLSFVVELIIVVLLFAIIVFLFICLVRFLFKEGSVIIMVISVILGMLFVVFIQEIANFTFDIFFVLAAIGLVASWILSH